MKLNFVERLFIIGPIRPLLQKHLEARQLLEMGGSMPDGRVLQLAADLGAGLISFLTNSWHPA